VINFRNSIVNDGAQSYSHVPTIDKQESLKKQVESDDNREEEEDLLDLP